MYDIKLFLVLVSLGSVAACQQIEPLPPEVQIIEDDSYYPGKYK